MRRTLWPVLVAVALFGGAGCSCGGTPIGTDDAAVGDDATVNLTDGPLVDAVVTGDIPFVPADALGIDLTHTCASSGQSCVTMGCCIGTCDPTSKTCIANCTPVGGGCASPTECCTLHCVAGFCGTACKQNSDACVTGADCCSGNCVANVCQPIVTGGCVTLGNFCAVANDCCSKNCQGNLCIATGAGCQALGDVCFKGLDCCSGKCDIPMGKMSGECAELKSGGCTTDGEPCSGCSNCCSRTCAPTMTGGVIRQIAGGCRIQDATCYKDSDCCGAPGSGLPGDGLVTCVIVQGTVPPVGFCSQPSGGQVCNPVGNVCGIKPQQACGGNAREDCCDCLPPKFNCCKLDKVGVPRCYGGSTTTCPNGYTGVAPCCIAAGNQCSFASECCNGAPCLPDSMGVLRCGTMCEPAGAICTSTADCCQGLPCVIPQGKTVGTCGAQVPTDGGVTPTDGGVAQPDLLNADLKMCSLLGQSCKVATDCCTNLTCTDNTTGQPCNGGAMCSCFGSIM